METCALGPGSPAAVRSRCACAEMRRRRRRCGWVEVCAPPGEVWDPAPGLARGPPARGTCGPGQHGPRSGRSPRKRAKVPQAPCCPSSGARVQPVALLSLVPAPAHVLAGVLPEERVTHPLPGRRCPLSCCPGRSRALLGGSPYRHFCYLLKVISYVENGVKTLQLAHWRDFPRPTQQCCPSEQRPTCLGVWARGWHSVGRIPQRSCPLGESPGVQRMPQARIDNGVVRTIPLTTHSVKSRANARVSLYKPACAP